MYRKKIVRTKKPKKATRRVGNPRVIPMDINYGWPREFIPYQDWKAGVLSR